MNLRTLLLTIVLAGSLWGGVWVRADDDDDEHERSAPERREQQEDHGRTRGPERKQEEKSSRGLSSTLASATNPVYTDTCAACHFAYPPALLPARSWARVIAALPEHFGESVDLDAKDRAEIAAYLQAQAADHSRAKRAASILRSVGSESPARITEIPYIRSKHRELSAAVLKRKSIGSLSNCNACHQQAAQGVFDEDDVRIPRS